MHHPSPGKWRRCGSLHSFTAKWNCTLSYTHLSQDERYQIQHLHRGGFSIRDIGEHLQRDPSTIRRELERNTHGAERYDARQAHRRSTLRWQAASARPHLPNEVWPLIEARLADGLSPEQIAGEGRVAVSHERIYQHVARDRQRGGTLWHHMRRRKRRRRARCGTPRQRQRFGGRRIGERPDIVQARQRVGDWEGDTVVGQGTARLVTLVERKSGLLRVRRVATGEADPTMRAVIQSLYPLAACVHTITWDNGSEFAQHAMIDIVLGAESYFADPYSSWQRGTNENTNGLLRQYFPKGCDLSTFSDSFIQSVEDKLNSRPRKRLGFHTPQQIFDKSFKRALPN